VSPERPRQADGLEVHEVDDGLVVYDQKADRVHYLNASASVVFELCSGQRTLEQIAAIVAEAWRLPSAPGTDVAGCVGQLRSEGVLV
jgi:hypothetical protein